MQTLKKIGAGLLALTLIVGIIGYINQPAIVTAAPGPQIFYGSTGSTMVTSNRWIPLNHVGNINSFATSTLGIFPINGTFSNMTATVDTAPGGATSWVVTLDENNASTGHTCTITSAITTCTASGTYSASANRVFSIKFTTSGGTPASSVLRASIQFTPSTAGHTALVVAGLALSNSGQRWTPVNGNGVSWNTPETARQQVLASAGTLQNFYANLSAAPGVGKSYQFTLRNQNASTTVTCTVADTDTSCNDLVNTASVSADDVADWNSIPSGTPSAANNGFGIDFVPSVSGDFTFQSFTSTADSASAVNYMPIAGAALTTVEASSTHIAQAMTVTRMSVNIPTAPGATKSRIFTLRKNGADTALQCWINGTGKTCNITGSIAFVDGDTVDISDDPGTTTPSTSSTNSVSLIANTNTADAPADAPPPVPELPQLWVMREQLVA